jgi:outer membrane lipoprotein LolB
MHPLKLCVCLLLTALASGCATQAPTPASDWNTHRQSVTELGDWSFSGKIAVKSRDGADSARLSWRQHNADLELEVSGPVGMGQVTLVRQDGTARMFSDGQWQDLDAAGTVLEDRLGWPLPLDYLSWWLRGLPAPQLPTAQLELVDGRLHQLAQGGWQVEYREYQQVSNYSLPRTILFRRDPVEGKILLKQWVLGQ